MAENRRNYALTSQLDLEQILRDARNRWLRPVEVCEILRNHQKFTITAEPPNKPSAGSLFLFDRKALRYFRKDGHNWRKKKDGKTVREAHEKLKAGSVDVLHCYYAHGQDNENFQRRCYWMLDGQYEHIVFVHYREVKESNRAAVRSARNDRSIPNEDVREQQFSVDSTIHSSTLPSQSTYASSPSTADWNGTPEYEDGESTDDIVTSTPIGLGSSSADQASCQTHISTIYAQASRDFSTNQSNGGTRSLYPSNQHNDQSMSEFYIPKGIKNSCNTPPMRLEETGCYQSQQTSLLRSQEGNGNTICQNYEKNLWLEGPNDSFFVLENSYQSTSNDREFPIIATSNEDSQVLNGVGSHKSSWGCVSNATDDSQSLPTMQTQSIIDSKHQNNILIANGLDFYKETTQNSESVDADLFLSKDYQSDTCQPEPEKCIKKLDSFGQWMSREMGESDSLVASDSGTYWNTLDNQSGMEEVSSLSHQMHLDVVSMAPSISQDQLFSVVDFSPDWSYSDFETKILITGNFLGSPQDLQKYKWSCMFGEIEVPAEVLSFSVLRCYAPRHIPGRVPFYITCSNRLACSEVREFEYRSLHPEGTNSSYDEQQLTETLLLQIRFVKLLSVSIDEKAGFCTVDNCEKCNIKEKVYFLKNEEEDEWGYSEDPRKPIKLYIREHQEKLLEKLLKEKLHDWLIWKLHDGDKGANIFDDKGQGVIHLAAALGYEWAILPIITAGVSVNFRDIRGWTALHWAAYYGREDTVVMLVTLGASAGAVTDPTPKFRLGLTPADLASDRGHKGISGFLAESHLTNQFYTLSMKESVKDNINASLDVEKTAGSVFDVVSTMTYKGDTELEYKGTLQALRNSEQAAARIQTVYRMNSLRMKQRAASDDPNNEILTSAALLTSSKQKSHRFSRFSHRDDALHSAASRIQHKYRGWKGRREFLLLRSRIVKIQAHIRGHNVRKEYKKVVWSVGIVEKAVLRWRRKGVGLRGFRAEAAADHTVVKEDGGTNEYDYLREGRKQTIAGVEKALARVQSMARYPEARDQYQRLQISYQNKVNNQKLIDADNSCKEKSEAGSSDLKML